MCNLCLQIKKLHPDAVTPSYAHAGDSGFDLYSVEDVWIYPGEAKIVPTGLAVSFPKGFEMQIRMRSGASLKTPLIIANSPGTVDSGYRGEIGLIVRNVGQMLYIVKKGERIAQGVIVPVMRAAIVEVQELDATERGSGAYGSTG